MVSGIYAIINDNGRVIKLIEKNALKMEDSRDNTYYLWSDRENLHRIKSTYVERPKGSMNYIIRVEIDSTPPDAKIPKKLEELIKKYESS